MSSNTNSSLRTSAASSSSVSPSESSTLRSVERSAWLRMSASDFTPPAIEYSCWTTLASFARTTSSTCLTTSGLVSPIRAIRSAMSACSDSGRCASTAAAKVVCRFATTRAIVAGASLRKKVMICSGGVRRRNSNGRISITVDRRPMISSARTPPSARSSTSRAYSTPPAASESYAMTVATSSSSTVSVVAGGTRCSFAISSESASISSSRRCLKMSAARSRPSDTSSTAAFLRPFIVGARPGCPGTVGLRVSSSSAIAGR